ncbi:TetR/AcrR family transcriptional regulator [Xenorhabdus sp. SGI240]|uniref:TetR/AcrR family transcriptional regulator n=1 Tax=Xenorhabdus sp. SGI240 TaxID=3158262 RepID=UPI0032B7DE3B
MVRRTRTEMEKTRITLLATARKIFGELGYANTSMDDLTAQANLTRGALYHHFGDKKGLLVAVVAQIDTEMDARLRDISDSTTDAWTGFRNRCRAYLEMAQEPEIQRIVLRDAKSVLGHPSPGEQQHCIESMQKLLAQLMQQGIVVPSNPEALTLLIYGSLTEAAFWIAESGNSKERLTQALAAMEQLLRGIRS